MNRDLIYRKDAINALGEEPVVWHDLPSEISERNQWRNDVAAIEAVPSAEEESFEWCHDCKEYDQDAHCCHRFTKQIRKTIEELKEDFEIVQCIDCKHREKFLGRWVCKHVVFEPNEYDHCSKAEGKEDE